jgi:glycosyltransferase involved in cell wall biosynthesis
MRVGYLSLQAPDCSPSQRYRVEAFESRLRRRGIDVRSHWVLSRRDLDAFYGSAPAARKAQVAASALWRRIRSLSGPSPDLWLVQREAFFLGNEWAERLAARRAPLVFDFDDAIWIRTTATANRRYAWLKNVAKVPRIAALAHTVVAGNAYLRAWAANHAPRVRVIPTCVDTDVFAPPTQRSSSGPVVIGWSGSASTIEHLRPLLPVLERVTRRFGDRVSIRVMGDPTFAYPPLDLRGEVWTPDGERALLQRMDIGLMPLPDDEWTRGKCGLKGLVAMAVGAATVMSPVGVNTEIVRPGENGLLATSDEEWFERLVALVEEPSLRARLGAAARQAVVDRYSVDRWCPALAEVFEHAAGQ